MKSLLNLPINRASMRTANSTLVLLALTALSATAFAAPPPDHWVGTWGTAVMVSNNGRPALPPGAALPGAATLAPGQAPATAPAAAAAPPAAMPPAAALGAVAGAVADANAAARPGGQNRPRMVVYGTADTTLREIVHVSIGGPKVRVTFTNEFGTEPLTIGAAHVAVSQGSSTINLAAASASGLTFDGRTMVTIPPGAIIVSDPAAVTVPPGSDLAVSFFLPVQPITHLTAHGAADQTSYTAPGNVVGAKTLDSPTEIRNWPFIRDVDVLAPAGAGAVVAFGDSITDGAFAANNQNARWPDELARRLLANPKTANVGVLNEGIGGNRILHDNTGPNALARFDRDVITQPGVKYVIVLEAINDIGHAYDPGRAYDVVTADDLIMAYKQMAERAHTHGIKIYFATLTPYTGAKYYSPAGEEVCKALNTWMRTSKDIDGFIDFEKATQDPANPAMYLPAFDHGDHLHPSDPGYKAMGDAIDLNLFIDKK